MPCLARHGFQIQPTCKPPFYHHPFPIPCCIWTWHSPFHLGHLHHHLEWHQNGIHQLRWSLHSYHPLTHPPPSESKWQWWKWYTGASWWPLHTVSPNPFPAHPPCPFPAHPPCPCPAHPLHPCPVHPPFLCP